MSPAGLAKVFAALAVRGARDRREGSPPRARGSVLPFAGLEVLLLGAAFVLYARHAADYERIELDAGGRVIEVADGARARYELNKARVSMEEGRVVLRDAREELEVGRHLGRRARAELAAELKKTLIRGRTA